MASVTNIAIDFCTLGMFIIDEIHFQSETPPVTDVLGGAGTYSVLGARLFSPQPASRSLGWIVDCGSDFPAHLRKSIARWETSCLLRETPERLTTRGWNSYGDSEHRAFRYTTPKLRIDEHALTPELLRSKSFHLICSPARCIELAEAITALRAAQNIDPRRPLLIWEPVPDKCVPSELERCREALQYVDVISPNHGELCAFFGRSGESDRGAIDLPSVESCGLALLDTQNGFGGRGAVVVRAGKEGCLVLTSQRTRWLPAYHESSDRVVDPTGGGNMFLGGLAIKLARQIRGGQIDLHDTIEDAAVWGSVAASFAIEQVGMPQLEMDGNEETWNGVRVLDRLREFEGRLESKRLVF